MSYIPLSEPLLPEQLDALLALGWYRMRQHVFTTDEVWLTEQQVVPVYWARVVLEGFTPNHRHRKLARLWRRFRVNLQDAAVTGEIEDLYTAYRNGVDFEAGPTAASFLLDERSVNFFPSKMWLAYDGDRLIAAGYFDEGTISAAGILNFYHPAYRKYSPGLWLYLESIRHAALRGCRYFYPGYVATGYPKFDYKLLAGPERMELWDPAGARWIDYAASVHAQPAPQM